MIRGANSFHEPLHTRHRIASSGPQGCSALSKDAGRALLRRGPHEYSRLRRLLSWGGAPRGLDKTGDSRYARSCNASCGVQPGLHQGQDRLAGPDTTYRARSQRHPQVIMLVLLAVRAGEEFGRREPSARPEGLPPPGLAAEHGVDRLQATGFRGDSGSGEACASAGPPPRLARHPTWRYSSRSTACMSARTVSRLTIRQRLRSARSDRPDAPAGGCTPSRRRAGCHDECTPDRREALRRDHRRDAVCRGVAAGRARPGRGTGSAGRSPRRHGASGQVRRPGRSARAGRDAARLVG